MADTLGGILAGVGVLGGVALAAIGLGYDPFVEISQLNAQQDIIKIALGAGGIITGVKALTD